MKKLIFMFSLFILIFSASAEAHGETMLPGGSFEDSGDGIYWSGGALDQSTSFSGNGGFYLCNPFGEERNGLITHVLEYSNPVYLEAGHVYTLCGYAFNPVSESSSSVHARASESEGTGIIVVNISGIGGDWSEFSTSFYVSESKEYNLSLYFGNGDLFMGFFVDEIKLYEEDFLLSSIELRGQTEILIPAFGTRKIRYSAFLYSSDGASASLLTSSALYISASDCPGTTFSSSDMSLTVSSEASNATFVTLSCMLANSTAVSPVSLTVSLSDNLIDDSSFDNNEYGNLWTGASGISLYHDDEHGNYIGLSTNGYNKYGFFTSIRYNEPQVLLEGTMYVLHADIKSDLKAEAVSIFATNTAESSDGTLIYNITDVSSDSWQSVTAAFVPLSSGVYNIEINLSSPYDSTVFIDNIRLCAESPAPTYVTLHAPGNISLPGEISAYPINAYVRDQAGNILEDLYCSIELISDNNTVSFDESTRLFTVSPDSLEGEYTFRAVYSEDITLSTVLTLNISTNYIGDGGFEKKPVNEWWVVSSPFEYTFTINNNGNTKYAHIENDGEFFILANNSYMYLSAEKAYVFTADVSASSPVTVTAFLEDTYGSLTPLVQFEAKENVTELFLAENSSVGRLLLYIQSSDANAVVNLDNISVKNAIVSASGAVMNGEFEVNGAAKAVFSFYNNVANSSDTSSCVINWYISDSADGEYAQLPGSGMYIYVYFEVTPVCPLTGFSGATVRSSPVFISAGSYDYSSQDNFPSQNNYDAKNTPSFSPIDLTDSYETVFSDICGHWGERYILSLAAAGVLSGRGDGNFDPDSFITRAEFSKILCLAFGVWTSETNLNIFEDIETGSWYMPYVLKLHANGIINGVSDKNFAPEKNITREEATVMIMRIYEKLSFSFDEDVNFRYNDDSFISSWARASVYKAGNAGIAQGMDGNIFMPLKTTSRAEAAALVCRTLEVIRREKQA